MLEDVCSFTLCPCAAEARRALCRRLRANVQAEMKYIVAALYSNYSTSIVDDSGIEQTDSYTAPPQSDKLMIRLERLAN
jgi:GTP cyclohydrolase FolE2